MGIDSRYWSSTAYLDVNNTYYLHFGSAKTYPSDDSARWLGFSVHSNAHNSSGYVYPNTRSLKYPGANEIF